MYPLTLQDIRRSHGITMPQLAAQAGVTSREVYLLEIGATVAQERTQRIMDALTTLTGEPCQQAKEPVPVPDQPTLLLPALPFKQMRRDGRPVKTPIVHSSLLENKKG